MAARIRAFGGVLLIVLPLLAQDQAPQEHDQSTLEVKPGPPAIKESERHAKPVDPWKRMPSYILHDQAAIWTSPFHTAKADAKWWFIFGGATAGLIVADKHIAHGLPNTSGQVSVSTWTSRIGAGYTLAALNGAFYLMGVHMRDDHLRETGFLGAEALADCLLVQAALKAVTDRERPLEGSGEGKFWSGLHTLGAGSSFPSGHSIETWTFASVIAHEYPRPVIVPIAAYGLATTVSLSRLAARKHFASDALVGAAIGWFVGDYVYGKRHNPEVDPPSKISRVMRHVHFGFGAD